MDDLTPNSDSEELLPVAAGRGGCDDERLRPIPKLFAVFAGRDETVKRTTGNDCSGGETGCAVPGGDDDCDDTVPVEDLLLR
jgi:hypothetical protein